MTSLPFPIRAFARPVPLVLLLAFFTAIPVLNAAVLSVQIPLGAVPEGTLRLMIAPVSLFLHSLSGLLFALAGPVQFSRALRNRFGRLHRATGLVFVVSGLFLGGSGLSLLLQVQSLETPIASIARGIAGVALILALHFGMTARSMPRHRAWMIRAYAIGMGLGTVGLVFFPIYLFTGAPPRGIGADLLFAACWGSNALVAEYVIRRLEPKP